MRFVISLFALRPGRIGGTEQWLRSLLGVLPAALGNDEVVVVAGTEAAAAVATPGLGRVVLDLGPRDLVARRGAEAFTPWRDRRLENAIGALRPDAVFFPQISVFPKNVAAPVVTGVGDVQHLVLPDNFSVVDRAFRRAVYPRSFAKARVVIAASEHTRRELLEFAGVDAAKIRVVRHGCPPMREAATTAPPPVEGPYLYFPAATNPHKGHDQLLSAFAQLSGRDPRLRIVLTGERTSHWRSLETLALRLGIRQRVLHLGYVAPEVVESLYAHAAAMVFPSRFEGFGLPLVEAASLGAKVIASRLAVFDENGTEGVQYIDFADPAQLAAALASPGRARIADAAWNWNDAATATMAALREAAVAPAR